VRLLPGAFDKIRSAWQNMQLLARSRSGVIHLNCFDKALLSFEVNCTGQRIGYSGTFSVRGEPDPDRLRKAILSTARSHPELMTTLRGGPLRHYRRVHDDFVGEALEVQDLAALQAQRDSVQADTGTLYEQRIHEWTNRPLDTRKNFPFRVLLLKKGTADYALVFTLHHSAIDGVRAIHLIDDVISRYHNKPTDASGSETEWGRTAAGGQNRKGQDKGLLPGDARSSVLFRLHQSALPPRSSTPPGSFMTGRSLRERSGFVLPG
jgi:hypothetical protein